MHICATVSLLLFYIKDELGLKDEVRTRGQIMFNKKARINIFLKKGLKKELLHKLTIGRKTIVFRYWM
jgi:hypothetical protein